MNTFTFHFEIQARTLAEAIAQLGCSGHTVVTNPQGGTVVIEAATPAKPAAPKPAAPKKETTKGTTAKAEPKAAAEAEETPTLTLEEVREVSGLLTKTGRSREAKAILESYFNVGKLADLNPDDYSEAIRLFKETAEKPPLEE